MEYKFKKSYESDQNSRTLVLVFTLLIYKKPLQNTIQNTLYVSWLLLNVNNKCDIVKNPLKTAK